MIFLQQRKGGLTSIEMVGMIVTVLIAGLILKIVAGGMSFG